MGSGEAAKEGCAPLRKLPRLLVACWVVAGCTASSPSSAPPVPSPPSSSVPAALAPDDWPQIGYDGGHARFNAGEHLLSASNVGGLVQRWRVRLRPRRAVWISDGGVRVGAVVGDRVFASWSSDEAGGSVLSALDRSTGRIVWVERTPVRAWWFVGVAGANAIVSSVHEGVRALDAATGAPRWSVPGVTAVAIDPTGSDLYVASNRTVSALASSDGRERWHRDIAPTDAGRVRLIDGALILGEYRGRSRSGRLVALDAATGETRWIVPVDCALGPAAEGRVYTGCGPSGEGEGTALTAWSVADGAMVWTRTFRPQTGGVASADVAGEGVVVVREVRCVSACEGDGFGTYRGALSVLDAATGRERWAVPPAGASIPPWMPDTIANGVLFVTHLELGRAHVGAMSLRTGRMLWSTQIGSDVFAYVDAVSRGEVFVGAAFGMRDPIGGTLTLYRLPA
jgi:outer membrane protein assembly factor BamB